MKSKKVIHKTIIAAITAITILNLNPAFAIEENTIFRVNVKEILSVSVSSNISAGTGDIDNFLRNRVDLSVTSNNSAGFTATMTTKTANTSLVNSSKNTITLPTLSTATYPSGVARSSFPANYWGYSFDDTEPGSGSSTYKALVGAGSTPITVLSSANADTGSRTFYFGAKADATQSAGTYTGTVVINVVSGVIDDNNNTNPTTPTDPVTPSGNEVAVYNPSPTGGSSNGTTSYTYRRTSSGTTTTTTEISDGNNVSAYNGYTPPQGVFYKSDINDGSNLGTGLATVASVALASSFFFFILAKRKEDDEDEEEIEY